MKKVIVSQRIMVDPETGMPFKSARKAALAARKARRKQAVEKAHTKK